MKKTPLKILYGVQATGNGHIKRARAIVPYLQECGADVTCLFSGRARDKLFDMDPFEQFDVKNGFTFVINQGRVDLLKTLFNAKARQFASDVHTLDVRSYDLVLTDFEPVTAWAAKTAGIPCIGIGNQYAFQYDIPKVEMGLLDRTFMKQFAPARLGLGLHWHHFNQPVLPPIVDTMERHPVDPDKIIVYMDHENLDDVCALLHPFDHKQFFIYASAIKTPEDRGHLLLRPPSRDGFRRDLAESAGVITNAGFELPTETLQLGKKLLVKALDGQLEQLSNVKALRQLNLAGTMDRLDQGLLEKWLHNGGYASVTYPDTAKAIAEWIVAGDWNDSASLVQDLWARTRFSP